MCNGNRSTILIEYVEYLTDFIYRFYSTIKTVLNHKQVKFHQVFQVLLDKSLNHSFPNHRFRRKHNWGNIEIPN